MGHYQSSADKVISGTKWTYWRRGKSQINKLTSYFKNLENEENNLKQAEEKKIKIRAGINENRQQNKKSK